MKYTIIFWGTYSYGKEIFILQKKIVRITAGAKTLEIHTQDSVYFTSAMWMHVFINKLHCK